MTDADDLRRIAAAAPRVCTEKEIEALAAYLEHGNERDAAEALDISRGAYRDRFDSAKRKVRRHLDEGTTT